jgi:single-stranded-DNA-specific exonuclease
VTRPSGAATSQAAPLHDEWLVRESPEDAGLRIPIRSAAIRKTFAFRGVTGEESYRRFAFPEAGDLHDPALIHGIAPACERIERAIRDREQILIYGDYDVDGVTSIVLLRTVLRTLGADVGYVIPHRVVDGYGLKMEVLERVLTERNVRLVITVDCGISSVEPVEAALERGIDVIVTDHHLPPGTLPAAAAVINPHQEGCTYPFKELAGVGVAFKLCCALLARSSKRISLDSLLKIAAVGTVADVAPLVGENRTIARLGLDGLADVRNRGLRALLRRLGLLGRPLSAFDIGFLVGPRINAAGRLASADAAIRLFEAASDDDARAIVEELEQLNTERRTVEARVLEEAERQVDPASPVIVAVGEGWHRGVVGLCAGRLAQKYHRPALVLSREDAICVGSGRSIPTVDLHRELAALGPMFTHFGGHEFACGFTLASGGIEEFRREVTRRFEALPPEAFVRRAAVDAILPLSEIDRETFREHQIGEPYGQGNRRPLFLARDAEVVSRREFSPGCYEIRLREGESLVPAVLWRSLAALASLMAPGEKCELLFHLEQDRYSPAGFRLSVVDAARQGEAPLRNESIAASVAVSSG